MPAPSAAASDQAIRGRSRLGPAVQPRDDGLVPATVRVVLLLPARRHARPHFLALCLYLHPHVFLVLLSHVQPPLLGRTFSRRHRSRRTTRLPTPLRFFTNR